MMKVEYQSYVDAYVMYDGVFERKMYRKMDDLLQMIEEDMWIHHFDNADVCDADTGELLVTVRREV